MGLLTGASDFALSVLNDDLTLTWNECCSVEPKTSTVEIGGISGGNAFVLSRIGQVALDTGSNASQPSIPVNNAAARNITAASCYLAVQAAGDITFEVNRIVRPNPTGAVVLLGTFTIPAGEFWVSMASLVGLSLPADAILSIRVTTGSDGQHLNVTINA